MKEKTIAIILTLSVLALFLWGFISMVAWIWRGVF